MKAIILAAGLGSRLKQITDIKPLAKINGEPLLNRLPRMMFAEAISSLTIALNSQAKNLDFTCFPSLQIQNKKSELIFVDTPSSMHTLYELLKKINPSPCEHILASMIDTILKPNDFSNFINFCRGLETNTSALLTTTFIDDEKPVVVEVNEESKLITNINIPLTTNSNRLPIITSGMYCFSGSIFPLLEEAMDNKIEKMRNFLQYLLIKGHKIKAFTVNKTLDIDRPEDLALANNFINDINNEK